MADNESRDFCWIDGADAVIVPDQPAVACYLNPAGDVVLRQRGDCLDPDDAYLWFAIDHAPAIAKGILEVAGLSIADLVPEPTPVGSKAAQRQKRYRDRQKKELTTEPDIFDRDVTGRDTVTRDGDAA